MIATAAVVVTCAPPVIAWLSACAFSDERKAAGSLARAFTPVPDQTRALAWLRVPASSA